MAAAKYYLVNTGGAIKYWSLDKGSSEDPQYVFSAGTIRAERVNGVDRDGNLVDYRVALRTVATHDVVGRPVNEFLLPFVDPAEISLNGVPGGSAADFMEFVANAVLALSVVYKEPITVTGTYSLTVAANGNNLLIVDTRATGGGVYFPNPAITKGVPFTIKNFSGLHTVLIEDEDRTWQIEGSINFTLAANKDTVTIMSDGTEYKIVSAYIPVVAP